MPRMRVRMYRQGLGDCFLLTITDGGTSHHVLIDCGVLTGTPDVKTTMAAVADDIHDVTGSNLDAVVATHEHWDHISGFLQAEARFDELTIDEAWLAWTENPHDDQANQLRAHRANALRAVAAAAQAWGVADPGRAARLQGLMGFYGELGVDGRPTTAKAMEWIKNKAKPRYLEPGTSFTALGVRVFVLGPPRDARMIRKNDPSRVQPEVYELAADADLLGDSPEPFDAFFRLDDAAAQAYPLIGERYAAEPWRRIDHDWLGAAEGLGLQLDSDTNNTSVVLAFELGDGGPILLFPGDAQVGNWLSWETLEWQTAAGPVRAADLLARTALYKVGHHGSHNATLREKGLELMTSPDLVAMIPVNRVMARKQEWNMPLPSLLRRLEERTRGRILDAELGRPAEKPDAASAEEWARFLERTDVQDRWVDYVLSW